ncbi:hypothetical protein FQZ97_936950 [compost metagenome]
MLLKIEKTSDLKIDKQKIQYLVLEIDSIFNPVKDSSLSMPVYFKDFTDSAIFSCAKKDSINLKTLVKEDTFDHDNNFGIKNFKMIETNSKKMNYLMKLDVTSSLYNQEIHISYTLLNCNYCIGTITKYDSKYIDYTGDVILIIDNLVINNKKKISYENLYSFVKAIDFNTFLF